MFRVPLVNNCEQKNCVYRIQSPYGLIMKIYYVKKCIQNVWVCNRVSFYLFFKFSCFRVGAKENYCFSISCVHSFRRIFCSFFLSLKYRVHVSWTVRVVSRNSSVNINFVGDDRHLCEQKGIRQNRFGKM